MEYIRRTEGVARNGSPIKYKITPEGLAFHETTNDKVVEALVKAYRINKEYRLSDYRIRVFYGDTATGECWLEEHNVMGTVGNSTGDIKIPILLSTARSTGGVGILTQCIVRITVDKSDVYRHPNFHVGELNFVTKPDSELPCEVHRNEKCIAAFKNGEQARRWTAFIRGERNSK